MKTTYNCSIWDTPANEVSSGGDGSGRDGISLDSKRAGGQYFISRSAEACMPNIDKSQKVLLTDWLIEQRRLGVVCPKIMSSTIEDIKNRASYSVIQKAENLVQLLNEKTNSLGQYIQTNDTENNFEILAHASIQTWREIKFLIEYCEEKKWVKRKDVSYGSGIVDIQLAPAGYAYLSELAKTNVSSTNAFVAMWFDNSMNDAYKHGIDSAIQECGYNSVRVDAIEHVEKIDDRIIAEIKRAKFVVVDFTSEKDKPRGGVYYEAGYAQGLNIPVIWTCRQDCIEHVHFDTRQFNHIVWEEPADLKEKLKTRIAAVIGDGPNISR